MRLALFDIDGTLTGDHVWKGLMAYFTHHRRKLWVHRAYLLTHYPLYLARKAHLIGEATFRYRWAADLGWYLRGERVEQGEIIGQWVAETYLRPTWRQKVVNRLKEHLTLGDTVVLISTAPDPLVRAIARHLGTPHGIGSRFETSEGRFTGKPAVPLCLGEKKIHCLRLYLEKQGIPLQWENSTAYADSITDLAILEAVAHPVAVHPDAALHEIAQSRRWEIITG
ncbi:MAG: HAD family hydrolase [Anaerolineae bacterium]|nr:MAG: HAD family hydrolase [Anaerolineae bacterium]